MRLRPTIPFIDDETPASFAARLALVNGVNLNIFCEDFQLGLIGLMRGKDESLHRLSELSGVDLVTLTQAAWRAERPFAHYRGQTFGMFKHEVEGSRACVQCLLDDHAVSSDGACICFRGEWRVRALRTCDTHNTPIVDLPPTRNRQLLRNFTARVLNHWVDLPTPTVQRVPSEMETYIRARLRGLPHTPTWLDALPVRAVIASCETIGASAIFGDQNKRNVITEDGWWAAGCRGFQIASCGAESISAFLEDLKPLTTGALYAWFGDVKAAETDYDPFREMLTRHVVNNVAFHTSAKLFGRPLTGRKVHSVRSASEELRINPQFIRRVVLAKLPASERTKKNSELTFKVDAFADQWPRIASALQLRELVPYAGCTLRTAEILVRQGFINPVLSPAGDCPGIMRYAQEDVDAFLDKLCAKAVPVDEAPVGTHPISISPANIPCPVPVVINLILNGELSWVGRIENVHGFDSLLVDTTEVRKKLAGSITGDLTVNQAFHMMGVTARAFYTIAKAGLVELLPITQPKNRAAVPRITLEEISKFRKKYVSLSDVGNQLSIDWRRIKPTLDSAEIRSLDLGSVPLRLYERAHIARLYPAILLDTDFQETRRSPRCLRPSRRSAETALPKDRKIYFQQRKQSAVSATSEADANELRERRN